MDNTLAAALCDVRKAYRLLADYQQRLLELLAVIRTQLGATAYHHTFLTSRPDSMHGLENSNHSGIRYLPLLELTALWVRSSNTEETYPNDRIHTQHPGDVLFGVWIRSDNGYDEETNTFKGSAEDSQSQLIISAVHCDTPGPTPYNWFARVWQQMPYPKTWDSVASSPKVPGYRIYSAPIDLVDLADQTAVERTIQAWREQASAALDAHI